MKHTNCIVQVEGGRTARLGSGMMDVEGASDEQWSSTCRALFSDYVMLVQRLKDSRENLRRRSLACRCRLVQPNAAQC